MKLAFVFTNFNNSSFTEMAIKSIQRSDANTSPIVVVDNCSKKNDIEHLKVLEKQHSNVHVIYNKENVGYFSGLNIGIDYVRKHFPGAEYLIVGNNDLEFNPKFADELSRCSGILKKYPVVSPNIKTLDGEPQNPHVISTISRTRLLVYDLYYSNYYLGSCISKIASMARRYTRRGDENQHDVPQEIVQGYGACYILTPTFFAHFDKLWAPTFLMYEEFFLSKQLEEKNFKFFYEPSVHIIHHAHASTGKMPSRLRWELARKAHLEFKKHS